MAFLRNTYRGLIAAMLIVLPVCSVFAQKDDWGLWTSLAAEMKLAKKWSMELGGEYRWKEEITQTDQIKGCFDVGYKPWKFLKFGAGYELIADKKVKKDTYAYRHRFILEATGSYKYDRFTASWKPRLQATFYDKIEMDEGELDNYRWVVRNRLGLKYNVPKIPLEPYVQFEFFNRIFSDLTPSYYKNRLSIGLEYTFAKKHTFDFGYKRENELSEGKKYSANIAAVGYKFSFQPKTPKK